MLSPFVGWLIVQTGIVGVLYYCRIEIVVPAKDLDDEVEDLSDLTDAGTCCNRASGTIYLELLCRVGYFFGVAERSMYLQIYKVPLRDVVGLRSRGRRKLKRGSTGALMCMSLCEVRG